MAPKTIGKNAMRAAKESLRFESCFFCGGVLVRVSAMNLSPRLCSCDLFSEMVAEVMFNNLASVLNRSCLSESRCSDLR
jgi:hypothetical protein